MIKDILQQLAPLDEKIAALRGDPADENMTDITNLSLKDSLRNCYCCNADGSTDDPVSLPDITSDTPIQTNGLDTRIWSINSKCY